MCTNKSNHESHLQDMVVKHWNIRIHNFYQEVSYSLYLSRKEGIRLHHITDKLDDKLFIIVLIINIYGCIEIFNVLNSNVKYKNYLDS